MAPAKRKRTTRTQSDTPKKKRKHTLDAEQGEEFDSQEYLIKDILKETRSHYLIDWKGTDPKTKKNYEPTWEPRKFANKLAVSAWKEAKDKGLIKDPVIPIYGIPSAFAKSNSPTTSPIRPRRSRATLRKSRIIPSSSPAPTGQETAAPPTQKVSAPSANPDSSPLFVPADQRADSRQIQPRSALLTRQATEVRISRPIGFDSDQYEVFSESPASPAKNQAAPTSTDSSTELQSTTAPGIRRGVVPDSQSFGGSSGYVLTTQSGSKPETSTATGEITQRSIQAGTPSPPEPYYSFVGDQGSAAIREGASAGDASNPLSAEEGHTSSLYAQHRNSIPLNSPALVGAAAAESTEGQSSTSANLSLKDKGSYAKELDRNTVSAADPLDHFVPSGVASTAQPALSVSYLRADDIAPGTESNGSKGAAEAQPQVLASHSPRSIPSQFRVTDSLVNLSQDAQIIDLIDSSGDLHGFQSSQAVDEPSEADSETPSQQSTHSPSVDFAIAAQTTRSRSNSQEKLPSNRAGPETNIASAVPDRSLPDPPFHSTQYSTLGTDAPSRPATPDMPSTPQAIFTPNQRSSAGASGLGEKLKKMRAEIAAKRNAELQKILGSKFDEQGGCVIPANVPESAPGPEEIRTSERLSTLVPEVLDLPVVPADVENRHTENVVILPSALQEPYGRSMEFVVTLPAVAMTADQYKQTISYNRKLVQDITGSVSSPQPALTDQAWKLIERLEAILTHVDLDNDNTLTQQTQQDIIPEEQVKWDVTCSTKFRFLQYLIEELRQHDKHVVIFGKSGKTMDIAETFLRGHHVQYHRPDGSPVPSQVVSEGKLLVTLLSVEAQCSSLSQPADVIIVLDNALDANAKQIQELRSQAPVIYLIVINSPEHIKRCFPPFLDVGKILAVLVECVTRLRNMVGKLPGSFPSPKTSAVDVGQFIVQAKGGISWPLPELGRIPEVEHLVETYDDAQSSMPNGTEAASGRSKRPIELDEVPAEPTKKLRMTPQPDITDSTDPEVTRISETACLSTQSQDATNQERMKYSSLERRLHEKEEAFDSVRIKYAETVESIRTLERRLQEKEEAFDSVQTKYEDLSRQLRKQMAERAGSSLLVEESNRRLQALAAKLGEARDTNDTLRHEAAQWQALAQSSAVPEKMEMERVRNEARKFEEENKKVKASLRTLQSQFDFTRDQYQTASSAAAENASLLAAQRFELETLRAKASGETARLHQILAEKNIKKYEDEVEYLKQMLLDREALLKSKEEEIKLLKGRTVGLGTRATSLPRSPRMGIRSRQPSPNPGTVYQRVDGGLDGIGRLHPLRIS